MPKGKKNQKKPVASLPDRGKEPRSAFSARVDRKEPRAEAPSDPRKRSPVWAFRVVDIGGPWCWSSMDSRSLVAVLRRLKSFETMTWREIDGPTGSHEVPLHALEKSAQDRLEEIQQDDAAALFSLRIDGPGRVWGILEEHVLNILWWDPEHQVCRSVKKHT